MNDPTLADVIDAIGALRSDMEANTASILSDMATQTKSVLDRIARSEQRLASMVEDIGVN